MRPTLTIGISFLLLAAFSLFNVGLPVYSYLCPMMSSSNPVCDMWIEPAGENEAVTNQMGSCCAKVIVAERGTTPYLKAQEFQIHDSVILVQTETVDISARQNVVFSFDELALLRSEHSPPLFLLHASFLI